MLTKKLTVLNKLGLHARASAKLVALAGRYGSEIFLVRDTKRVNAKSIMGVMMLAACRGVELEVVVDGEDEVEALAAIEKLITDKFGEGK